MTIWVLGSEGLVGSTLCLQTACLGTSRKQVDILDRSALVGYAQMHPEIRGVINAAAFTAVDLAERYPDQAHLVNAVGAEQVAWVAKEMGVPLVHLSTDYVFDGKGERALCETDPTHPVNTYGKTKREGEQRVLDCYPEATILRTSSLFGKKGQGVLSRLMSLFTSQKEVYLTHDQINSPTSVKELAQAALELLPYSGIFHFANRGAASKYSIGLKLFQMLKQAGFLIKAEQIHAVPASFFQSSAPRPSYSVLDSSKVQQKLSFEISYWEKILGLEEV